MRYLPTMGRSPFKYLMIVVLFLLQSCEKEVQIDLEGEAPKMVVQGTIETNRPPIIILTSTIGFFSSIDLNTLQNSFIHDATITVNDGSKTVTLREYSVDTGVSNRFFFYSLDTANLGNIMLGEETKTYKLTIVQAGKTYTATTQIPRPKGPDTVWVGAPLFPRARTPQNAFQLFANYTDPDSLGNYVRYYTQRNNNMSYPSGIFSDDVVNGKQINNIALFAGDNESESGSDSLSYFYPGDTVTLRWSAIDKGVYKFWNSYEFSLNAVGNPFSTPINLISNISNGGLGVWAGYGTFIKTIVVPR